MARFIQGDRPEAGAELAMTGWELTKGRIFSHRFRAGRRFSRRSERGLVRHVTVLASSRLRRCGPASRGLVETERRARHLRRRHGRAGGGVVGAYAFGKTSAGARSGARKDIVYAVRIYRHSP